MSTACSAVRMHAAIFLFEHLQPGSWGFESVLDFFRRFRSSRADAVGVSTPEAVARPAYLGALAGAAVR